ncbi:MAG: sigma 54-interacting transcriptional regulator [Myxococcales bacterium]|nr:sigma 54-interacting transcriptional regulator [Myxococcales bacterium]
MKTISPGTTIQIGRDPSNTIIIDSPTISSFHCQISSTNNRWLISDLGSTNGTYLENVHIGTALLPAKGQIRLGEVRIPFHFLEPPSNFPGFFGLIGHSPAMREVFRTIQIVAQTNDPVLISGETGTGKELVAKAIHASSPRAQAQLISRNCGAIPESLADAELFGSVRGAFSEAINKPGIFEGAEGGTVFLDEIGELPHGIQAKLLRTLQEHKIVRLGELKERNVDFRLLLATHRNLTDMVKNQRFREDLYHRLSVFAIHLPPLRKRPGDISLIVHHLLQNTGVRITNEAVEMLHRFHWPGNVRQLQNTLKQASAFCFNQCIESSDLHHLYTSSTRDGAGPTQRKNRKFRSLDDENVRRETMAVWEQSGRSVSKAASILGIAKSTMHGRKERYRLPEKGQD